MVIGDEVMMLVIQVMFDGDDHNGDVDRMMTIVMVMMRMIIIVMVIQVMFDGGWW